MSQGEGFVEQRTTMTYELPPRHQEDVADSGGVLGEVTDRLVAVAHPDGAMTRYEYDDAGWQIQNTDRAGRTTTWIFDPTPRPQTRIDGVTGAISSEPGSPCLSLENPSLRLLAVVDPRGRRTSYAYDAATHQVQVTDADGFEWDYIDEPGSRVMPVLDSLGEVVGHVRRVTPATRVYRYVNGTLCEDDDAGRGD